MLPLHKRAVLALVIGSPLLGAAITPVKADYANGYSKVEQQFIDPGTGGGSGKEGSILNSTNPIDLMNKLRRGSAMDDATPPKDAIDAALRELEQPAKPQTATTAGVTQPTVTPQEPSGSGSPSAVTPTAKP